MNLDHNQSSSKWADHKRETLLKDIRSVSWDRQVGAFHFNTKLAQLLACGCGGDSDWVTACEKLVSCIPSFSAICGATGELVDPFRGARETFASNRAGDPSEIPLRVTQMWESAMSRVKTAGTGLYHGNLVEILEMSNILTEGASRDFYVNVLGMGSTPQEDVMNLLLDSEGEVLTGNATFSSFEGGSIIHIDGGRRVLWQENCDELFLSMEGYGCICRWRVVSDSKVAIIIQDVDAEHTSITNMAEHVRDACLHRLGRGIECYEFYEVEVGQSFRNPCLITGGLGEGAGFFPVPLESLPTLTNWMEGRVGGECSP